MKSSIESVGQLERRLNVAVPAQTVAGAFDRVFKSIQKDANIRGFRPGKAPLATIKSMYGDRVKQDVAQELIQSHYFQALQEHSLEPVNYPEFEFDVPAEDKDFSFTANFEIRPNVSVKNFEGLEIEKEKFDVAEKKVDEIIENIRNSHAKWNDLIDVRPAQKGDMAVLDFFGRINGEPLENGSGTDFQLELGSGRFIEGFEDGIVGMKVGETRKLNLKFPEGYQVAALSGQPVEFETTLKGLKKKSLPEIDAEFLAGLGGVESEAKLRENIRKDLEETEQKRIESDVKNNLLRALVKKNPVDVPASLLKEQKKALVEDMKRRLTSQGLQEGDFDEYTSKWDQDFETTAKEMVQSGFLIDALATEKNLRWTQEDYDKKLEEYAAQTGIEMSRIRDFYSKPEQMQRLTYMITEEKVIDFLMKTAKVKEVAAKPQP